MNGEGIDTIGKGGNVHRPTDWYPVWIARTVMSAPILFAPRLLRIMWTVWVVIPGRRDWGGRRGKGVRQVCVDIVAGRGIRGVGRV